MKLSDRILQVKPSATLAMNAKAQELRLSGKDIISLAVGELDFATPSHICLAAKEAIDNGFTKYGPDAGIAELRDAVGTYYGRNYGVSPTRDAVAITNGGKQSLFNLLQIFLDPGDEVIVPSPFWLTYPVLVELAGGKVVMGKTTVQDNYLATVDLLESLRTSQTKMLLLNSPSNPTGAVYSKSQLDSIMQWAIDHNIFVLADEMYEQLVYAPAKAVSAISWWEKYPENVAIINGLSKSFAMTGWRIGYTIAHPTLITNMAILQGQSTANVCSFVQKAATVALNGDYDFLKKWREIMVKRRDMCLEYIKNWNGATCPVPNGAFYLFIDISAYYGQRIQNSTEFCTYLLEKANVATVPGIVFGDDKCFRISYALGEEFLEQAMQRIGDALYNLD